MDGPSIIDHLETDCFCWLNVQCFSVKKQKQSVFYVIFLPTHAGEMTAAPALGADRVRVAVRVRPFSQVSGAAPSPCDTRTVTFTGTFLVLELVFKLLVIYGVFNLFK